MIQISNVLKKKMMNGIFLDLPLDIEFTVDLEFTHDGALKGESLTIKLHNLSGEVEDFN